MGFLSVRCANPICGYTKDNLMNYPKSTKCPKCNKNTVEGSTEETNKRNNEAKDLLDIINAISVRSVEGGLIKIKEAEKKLKRMRILNDESEVIQSEENAYISEWYEIHYC